MHIANIYPTSVIKKMIDTHYSPKFQPVEMYLSHEILKNREAYRELYSRPAYKIVDNSAYELMYLEGKEQAISMEDTLRAARIINADEIVLSDCPFDCSRSASKTRQAALQLRSLGWTGHMMAVVHGKNLEEVLACVDKVIDVVGVTTIGVPKYVEDFELVGHGRWAVAQHIKSRYATKNIAVHFLGLKTGMIEFVNAPTYLVRSCDTSYFFNLARRKSKPLTASDVWEPRDPKDEHTDFEGVADAGILDMTVSVVENVLGGL